MARFNVRRYDHQATLSLILSAVSMVFVVGTALLVFRNFNLETMTISYKTGSTRWMLLMACAGLSGLLSLLGLSFGANSAGQRRNDKQKQSWIGFFIGAFVLTVTIILLAFFFMRGEAVG